jgi:nucleoside-diphosphate kinase
MAARTDDSLLFVVEWYDPLPQLKKQYLLKYFPDQHMVEMVDIKSKKMFLRKSACPDTVSKEDFYIGSKILLFSRELDIVDYGDLKTKERFVSQIQTSCLIFPASAYNFWGKILDELLSQDQSKLTVTHMKTFVSNNNLTKMIYSYMEKDNINNNDYHLLSEGVNLLIVMNGENGFQVIGNVIQKFSSQFGISLLHSLNGMQTSAWMNHLFYSQDTPLPSTVTMDNCTCVIIKPHAVKARVAGKIIDLVISQGYEISCIRSVSFDKIQAEEFLEVYKGVIPEYTDHTIQLSSGLSIAMEIRAQNAVETFRQTAGPWDVDMAKDLRPDTIRGLFGKDRIWNAIHCTDLPEDGELECEYCFKLL